jgi:hypothetical protein
MPIQNKVIIIQKKNLRRRGIKMFIFFILCFFSFSFSDESCPKSFNTEILNNLQKKGSRCFIQSLDELDSCIFNFKYKKQILMIDFPLETALIIWTNDIAFINIHIIPVLQRKGKSITLENGRFLCIDKDGIKKVDFLESVN